MNQLQLIQQEPSMVMNQNPENSIIQSIEAGEEQLTASTSEPSSLRDTEPSSSRSSFIHRHLIPSNAGSFHDTPLYSLEQYPCDSREPSPTFSEASTVVESRWTGLLRDYFMPTHGFQIEQEDLDQESNEGDYIATVREKRDGQFSVCVIVVDCYWYADGLLESARRLLKDRLEEAVDEMDRLRTSSGRTQQKKLKVGGVLSIGDFSEFYYMHDKVDGMQMEDNMPLEKSLLHWTYDEEDIRELLNYWSRQGVVLGA